MSAISERSAFIEETGIFFESHGMTRMMGRIFGLLMVSDKDKVSFEEITQVLKASKSSISTSVRQCLNTGLIKAVTTPGDRKTYFALDQDVSWIELFKLKILQLTQMNVLFEKALHLRANPKDKSSQWLLKSIEFYDWVIDEIPLMLEKWNQRNINKMK
jgi:DNA-binding transcriptional regulator GbsR (MarR family)